MQTLDTIAPYGKKAESTPFCNSETDFPTSTSSTSVNYPDGFPESFSATDSSKRNVLRGDMNKLGRMASMEYMFRGCGGTHSIDQSVISGIGYPLGAVLRYREPNNRVRMVKSLKAENRTDFTSSPSTLIGPGKDWDYCDEGFHTDAYVGKRLSFDYSKTTMLSWSYDATFQNAQTIDGTLLRKLSPKTVSTVSNTDLVWIQACPIGIAFASQSTSIERRAYIVLTRNGQNYLFDLYGWPLNNVYFTINQSPKYMTRAFTPSFGIIAHKNDTVSFAQEVTQSVNTIYLTGIRNGSIYPFGIKPKYQILCVPVSVEDAT